MSSQMQDPRAEGDIGWLDQDPRRALSISAALLGAPGSAAVPSAACHSGAELPGSPRAGLADAAAPRSAWAGARHESASRQAGMGTLHGIGTANSAASARAAWGAGQALRLTHIQFGQAGHGHDAATACSASLTDTPPDISGAPMAPGFAMAPLPGLDNFGVTGAGAVLASGHSGAAGDITGAAPPQASGQSSLVDFNGILSLDGSVGSLSYGVPASLDPSVDTSFGVGLGAGFSINGYADVTAGISGGVTATLGDIAADYPVDINANALATVLDGTTFTVDPTLVSTNDANFQLDLAELDARLDLGLTASVGATLSGPSICLGFTSIHAPSPTINFSYNNVMSLIQDSNSFDLGGIGSLTIAEITSSSSVSSGGTSAFGSLPTVNVSGQTDPFLYGSIDLAAALEHFIPGGELLSGGGGEDGFSYSYDLLPLPLSVALSLGESVSISPKDILETVTDEQNGKSQSGTVGSSTFTFTAPSKGSGAIDLSITYTLVLAVHTSFGLVVNMDLALDGPTVSASYYGIGFSASVGQLYDLLNEQAELSLGGISTTDSLTGTTSLTVDYQATAVSSTLTTTSTGVLLNSAEEKYTVTAGGTINGGGYGIEATTQCVPSVTNDGSISGTLFGVNLEAGGSFTNQQGGRITAKGTGDTQGVVIAANPQDACYNAGIISGFLRGIVANEAQVINSATGTIISTANNSAVGIVDEANGAVVTNSGLISAYTVLGSGVSLTSSGCVYNSVHGRIIGGVVANGDLTLTNSGTISPGFQDGGAISAGNVLQLTNSGAITGSINNYGASGAGVVINLAGGVIEQFDRYNHAISLYGASATLQNAGTISGGDVCVVLNAAQNTLIIDQGASFASTVQAYGADNNIILAAPGGTLNGLGSNFLDFQNVTIAAGASWDINAGYGLFQSETLTGFGAGDRLDFQGLDFTGRNIYATTGDTVVFYQATGELDILAPGTGGQAGSIIASVYLAGSVSSAPFVATNSGDGIAVTQVPGGLGTLTTTGLAGITLAPNSLYGSNLTVTSTASVSDRGNGPGAIASLAYGIRALGEAATITNAGYIAGYREGIYLTAGGTITNQGGNNQAGGRIEAVSGIGVDITGGTGKVTNTGIISAGTAIALAGGGNVVNNVTGSTIGTIAGSAFGISLGANGNVINGGLITAASGGTAIYLADGGNVYNQNGGSIISQGIGILARNAPVTVNNCSFLSGTIGVDLQDGGRGVAQDSTIVGGVDISGGAGIVNNCAVIDGVTLSNGGSIINGPGAVISHGALYGVDLAPQTGAVVSVYVDNGGLIGGLYATGGDTIVNSGTISEAGNGIGLVARGAGTGVFTLSNSGTIIATTTGVSLDCSETITNTSSGTITGGLYGVVLAGAATELYNAGTITGGNDAVKLESSSSNVLALAAGAVFAGDVIAASGATNTIELTASPTAGILTGLGTEFIGFWDVNFASGAAWTIETSAAEAATFSFTGQGVQDRLVLSDGGALGRNLSGFGDILLDGPGTFTIAASALPTGTVLALAGGAELSGAGTLTDSVDGTGTIMQKNGALTLAGGFNFAGKLAGGSTITLTSAGTFAANTAIGAVAVIAEAGITLAKNTNLTVSTKDFLFDTTTTGETLSLGGSGKITVTSGHALLGAGKGVTQLHATIGNAGSITAQSGTLSLIGAISNSGTLAALGGTLVCSESVSGTGIQIIGAASTLWLQDGAASTQSIDFSASSAELALSHASTFLGTIAGFGASDLLELESTKATSLSYANGTLSVLDNSSAVAVLHFSGNYQSTSFSLSEHESTAVIAFA